MSRRFSSRLIANSVTHQLAVKGEDAGGGETLAWPTSVDLSASIQLSDPTRRSPYQGAIRSVADALAFFLDPISTTVDSKLIWHVVPGDSTQDRTFCVLGPATPESGQISLYVVPLTEVR